MLSNDRGGPPEVMAISLAALIAMVSPVAYAQAGPLEVSADLRRQIEPCFVPPADEVGTVRFAVELAPDGTLSAGPDVLTQNGSQAFVSAARRAILRCTPYRTDATGKVEIQFESEVSPKEAAGGDAPSGNPLPGAPVPYQAPDGFCFVNPTRSQYEAELWTVFQPPNGRDEIVETLAIDCPTLVRSTQGVKAVPVEIAMLARTEEPSGFSETLDAFLDRMARRFETEEALKPRFWQAPPVAGKPFLGRNAQAVYTAKRHLSPDGKVSTAALYGYTRIGGKARTFAMARFDGSDIHPGSIDRVAEWVRAAREQAGTD